MDIHHISFYSFHSNDHFSIIILELCQDFRMLHYGDVIMGAMAFRITSLTIACTTVYSGADQRKYLSPASLVFVREIHRGPVNSPHKRPGTRKMSPFDDVIMARCMLSHEGNEDNVSPNHGKHPSESSVTFLMHLSESCVRRNIVKFHKLQSTVHVVRPHAKKNSSGSTDREGMKLSLSWEIAYNRS